MNPNLDLLADVVAELVVESYRIENENAAGPGTEAGGVLKDAQGDSTDTSRLPSS